MKCDVCIAQYESGYHVLQNNTLMEMAKILNINYIHFIDVTCGCAEDIMFTFLWLDGDDRGTIHLFELVRASGKCRLLMINRYVTMTMMIGLLMPR